MNNENQQNGEKIEVITKETRTKLRKKECKSIWTRICPKCNEQIMYKYAQSFSLAKKKNSVCKACIRVDHANRFKKMYIDGKNPSIGKKMSPDQKKLYSERAKKYALYGKDNKWYGKTHSDETKRILSEKIKSLNWVGERNPFYGKEHTKETKIKIGDIHRGRTVKFSDEHRKNLSLSLSGKPKGEEQRKKLSISGKIRYLRELETLGLIKVGYNPAACKIIDEYTSKLKTNFSHAMNGGEKRLDMYFVDGFSSELNIVIEVDEKHHFKNNQLKPKDITRMDYIKEKYGCKFIRVKYNTDGSYVEYINDLINNQSFK